MKLYNPSGGVSRAETGETSDTELKALTFFMEETEARIN